MMGVTCCKTSLPLAGKTGNMCRFCWKNRTFLYILQQLDLSQDWLNPRVVKRPISLFNSFYSKVAKQVALFVARFTVPKAIMALDPISHLIWKNNTAGSHSKLSLPSLLFRGLLHQKLIVHRLIILQQSIKDVKPEICVVKAEIRHHFLHQGA